MAAIHLRMYEAKGPAILFENVKKSPLSQYKGTPFRAASNIFGTLERSKFIFRDTFHLVQQLIELKQNPMAALKQPYKKIQAGLAAINALPLKNPLSKPVLYQEINITDLPLVHHWPMEIGRAHV